MTTPLTLNGQIIGEAETSIRAVFDRLLAGMGTSFRPSVTLNVLTQAGGSLAREDLVTRVRRGLKVDGPAASAALDLLLAGGHARLRSDDPPAVEVTASSSDLHRRIRAGIGAIAARLYGDLPAGELATAARVLKAVTERANAELGEGGGGGG